MIPATSPRSPRRIRHLVWVVAAATCLVGALSASACSKGGGGGQGAESPGSSGKRGLYLVELKPGQVPKSESVYAQSIAVVIGIDDYQHVTPLKAAVSDAKAVGNELRGRGFTVYELLNEDATALNIRGLLGDKVPNQLGPDDRVLVFFAGHGVSTGPEGNKMGYLVPIEGRKDLLRATGISMSEVQGWLRGYAAKHVMFVADACYSGLALSTRSLGATAGSLQYLKDITSQQVRFTLVAGRDNQEANEAGGKGVFTDVFLQGLRGEADANDDGLITSDEVASFVKPKVFDFVSQNLNAEQTPQSARSGQGEFVFFRGDFKPKQRVDPAERTAAVEPAPDQRAVVAPAAPVQAPELVRPGKGKRCPAGTVEISGGKFFMGNPAGEGERDTQPQHRVELSPYCLDRTEVTVMEFGKCVDDGHCPPPASTVRWNYNAARSEDFMNQFCNASRKDRAMHPVNCVTWTQANDFCVWAGGRLPTEAEWEFAARGSGGRPYAWGTNNPDESLANGCGRECTKLIMSAFGRSMRGLYSSDDGWEGTSKVGSFRDGNSPQGVADLAGNVWELVNDFYEVYDGAAAKDPMGPETGRFRAARGGSWYDRDQRWFHATARMKLRPDHRNSNIGFRCVRSAK